MEAYDILFPITIRLPVKSLLRFQSVSKLWNAIISGKEFKKSHIDQSKASSPRKLLLVQSNDGVFEFRDLENPQVAMGKQQFPLQGFRNPTAMCSCDCLVLMKTSMDDNEYALWNPYTNEYRTFECRLCLNGIWTPHGCELCYDSSNDDYKVILIFAYFYMVYYVKRDCWTKKRIVVSRVLLLDERSRVCSPGISVNDRVFWSLGSLEINQLVQRYSTIIYFDVKSDELQEFPKPYFTGTNHSFRLTSLKGCVGLYCGNSSYGGNTCELDVWIMEQGGWTRLMKINCYNSGFRDQYFRNIVLLGCTRNGEILFQAGTRLEGLVIYDPKRDTFVKPVRISKDSKHAVFPICSESFYFPKPNVLHEQEKTTT